MSGPDSFTASKVVVQADPLLVALGDVDDHGFPRQSLLVSRDDEGPHFLYLELNGQGNACDEKGIKSVELGDLELRVTLEGAPLLSGAYDEPRGEPVSELRITFSLPDAALLELLKGLRDVTRDVCVFRYVGRRST